MANDVDLDLVAQFDARCQHVAESVHHLLHDAQTYGFYLWGPRGAGKSQGVEDALLALKRPYLLLRGTSTGPGVFKTLAGAANKVIWINDDTELLKDKQTRQYLLAMLEPRTNPTTGKPERVVTRTREKVKEGDVPSFVFKGKLIFDSNVGFGSHPALKAVADRIDPVLHFAPSDDELASVIRYVAGLRGKEKKPTFKHVQVKPADLTLWQQTTPKERLTVAEYCLSLDIERKESHSLRRWRDVLKWHIAAKKHGYVTDWRDHARSQLDTEYENSRPSAQSQRLESERIALVEILEDAQDADDPPHKNQIIDWWLQVTDNASSRQFFRRLAEIPSELRKVYASCPTSGTDNVSRCQSVTL